MSAERLVYVLTVCKMDGQGSIGVPSESDDDYGGSISFGERNEVAILGKQKELLNDCL